MHALLTATVFFALRATASPAANGEGDPVPGTPTSSATSLAPGVYESDGLIVTVYGPGEMAVDETRYIDTTKGARHEQCWDNHLSSRDQEAYEDDCYALLDSLSRSSATNYLNPGLSWSFTTSQNRCRATVRNESNCRSFIVPRRDLASNGWTTYDHCASLSQRSGWGWFAHNAELMYWLEPVQAAPPAYSPRCN
ncbi:hypothetical protein NQ176_g3572 [Zarea fungicola]|uniref:Uncharacterized protein n=1 Tax=Zarea fungicola TaxID=93591 RepID=A0ACC1NHW3_9HYPO|nr:hypothetical protein NQ176_g3572 [Lecanicillium fungicola]